MPQRHSQDGMYTTGYIGNCGSDLPCHTLLDGIKSPPDPDPIDRGGHRKCFSFDVPFLCTNVEQTSGVESVMAAWF